MKIKIFTPPKFTRKALNIEYLNDITNKKWQYASNGRASIYHILKARKIDKILIPIYICQTVLIPLKKLKITPVFYDIDILDLNPSLDSIKYLSEKYNIKTVLVASMYGNPANLLEIEEYCKENDIFMIDDAAQSFGAKLDNRYVGTFGNAGFFSFSPGKPTAGHMGSFFWSKDKVEVKRTKHFLSHYVRWLDIDINRNKIYLSYNNGYRKIVSLISRILLKFVNIDNDSICKFEEDIIGGILYDNLNGNFGFRQKYYNDFTHAFENNQFFRTLPFLRGSSNNHKFILVFYKKNVALNFINYMNLNDIYASNGYKLLSTNVANCPNAQKIDGRVVELPIENDELKMSYLFKKVSEFEY